MGHGLERLSDFGLRHGEGVSIGMMAAARISEKMGYCMPQLVERLENLLKSWGLPVTPPDFPVEEILQAMVHDKKKQGKSQYWVLPHAVGDVRIHDGIPEDVVVNLLKKAGGE